MSLPANPRVAIVIPAKNEADTIVAVVEGVRGFALPVVVDDGSTDGTGKLAADAGADVVRHAQSRGYDGALQAGFRRASELGVDVAASFDADGQFAVADLQRVLAPVLAGEAEVCLGIRPEPARFAEWLFGLYGRWRFGIPDVLCGVKAYAMETYRRLASPHPGRSIGTEPALAALRSGVRSRAVPVHVRPRQGTAPRFGSGLRANARILHALADAVMADLRGKR